MAAAEEIVALEREALRRWGAGDPEGFLEINGADVSYFDPFQAARIDGLPALRDLYAGIAGKISIQASEIVNPRVQVEGTVAVLTYQFLSQGSEGAKKWNCTEVFAQRDGHWRIIHTHWSFAP